MHKSMYQKWNHGYIVEERRQIWLRLTVSIKVRAVTTCDDAERTGESWNKQGTARPPRSSPDAAGMVDVQVTDAGG